MNQPNLFEYATKELSQDAVICWLVACARQPKGLLQQCGRDFIGALMRHGRKQDEPCVVTDVCEPKKQYLDIDVYFQARVGDSMVSFVVENKTGTEMHSGQLGRYKDAVEKDEIQENDFRLVYYKTGYVYDDERKKAEKAEYTVFEADDMQRFLEKQPLTESNEILRQYREYIDGICKARNDALARWNFSEAFVQYEFMKRLRDALTAAKEQWAGAISEKPENMGPEIEIKRGTEVGGSWTLCLFSKALFWRLGSDNPDQLRLRVCTEEVKNSYRVWTTNDNDWELWIDRFKRLASESGLENAKFGSTKYRGGELVGEGTVGAITLPGSKAEQVIPKIVALHIAFLNEIAPNGGVVE